MSFITTQQTKLDLELVPKENRLDIGKCNERIPLGLTPREPTFQVVLDAIALTLCYSIFLITADVPEIFLRVSGRNFDTLPFEEDIVSFLKELSHTGEINSLNDVVIDQMHQPWRTFAAFINKGLFGKTSGFDKLRLYRAQILCESTQIYRAILPKCLTSPLMKESKAYKTYLDYATGVVPPKIVRKFKKASPSKKDSNLVFVDEEPVTKGKRVKRSIKKSSINPATGIVIREPLITPPVTSEGTCDKGVLDVTKDESTESESESWRNDEDDSNDENDSENKGDDDENKSDDDKTPFDSEKGSDSEQDTDESEPESESDQQVYEEEVKDDDDDKSEGDEDRGMDDTTNQFSDDVQDKKADTTPTPPPTTETTNIPSLIPDITSVFRFNNRVISLEQDVAELKKDPPHTQVTALVDDHLDTRMGATREEFMNFLSASLIDKITEQTVKSEEPEFEVGDTDTPQGHEGNLGNDDVEPCGSFDLKRSLSLNEYKGLATLDKSKTTKIATLFKDLESMWNTDF
uniref:Uncharacterized protein n=1 Tax=Tanacetum cinerariifolium TaxID=118510 RepID=A0A6L2N3X0_TANCI|nr:hypothetical protein [Tanacetum cinerariifolium]